SCFN
ncbi:Down syndrome cell adhesion molecule-like protein Dscam2, partial [Araneus ventricosus]